mgnify:CR=1 FL=1
MVGGSAIEFYTEGAYTSGDLDLCLVSPGSLSLRRRQELMGKLQAEGGPRSWRVAGLFVDLLGHVESVLFLLTGGLMLMRAQETRCMGIRCP